MVEQRKFDWNKVGVQEIHFAQFGEITRIGLAGTIKRELEGRLEIRTAGIAEWVEALLQADPLCVMDHALGRFDIGPNANFAEQLAAEHHLVLPAAVFVLDFDQVAVVGRSTRHRPTFPVSNLDFATKSSWRESDVVKRYARFHHEAWYLPLVDRDVRAWLKEIEFTKPPKVQSGGTEVECGKERAPC